MEVRITRDPVRLTLLDRKGNRLLWEPKEGGVFVDDPKSPGGPDGGVRFQHAPGQRFYGIKAYSIDNYDKPEDPEVQGPDSLLRNGQGVKDNTYEACASTQGGAGGPLVWTTAGLRPAGRFRQRLLPHHRREARIPLWPSQDRDHNGRHYHRNNSVQYYLIAGTPKEILAAVAEITGHAPMFPRWAMGFTNSQWGSDQWSNSTASWTTTAPATSPSTISPSTTTGRRGARTITANSAGTATSFPTPTSRRPDGTGSLLKANAAKQGVVMTGIMKPRIVLSVNADGDQPRTEQAKAAADFGYPGVECHKEYLPPFRYHPRAGLHQAGLPPMVLGGGPRPRAIPGGIVGFWNDEADCTAVFDPHKAELFNNFGHFHMEQGLYEGQRAAGHRPQRPRGPGRSAETSTSAPNAIAYGMWSGDIHTGWESMRRQTVRMLSAVAVGEAKWGMDSGGFVGDDCDPENYARWIQFSSLVPIFRVHGDHRHQRQPWTTDSIMAEEIAKNAIQLRYRLAPYIYACDRQCYETGIGLVRPLMVEFPARPRLGQRDRPMDVRRLAAGRARCCGEQFSQENASSLSRPVYLPPGQWIDYFRGDVLEGGRTINYAAIRACGATSPCSSAAGRSFSRRTWSLRWARPGRSRSTSMPSPTRPRPGPPSMTTTATTYAYEEGNFSKQRIAVRDDGKTGVDHGRRTLRAVPRLGEIVPRPDSTAGRPKPSRSRPGRCRAGRGQHRRIAGGEQGGLHGDSRRLRAGDDHQAAGRARQAQQVELTGSQEPTNTAEILWAADASLSGETPQTRPQSWARAPSYVAGLDTDQGRRDLHAQGRVAGLLQRDPHGRQHRQRAGHAEHLRQRLPPFGSRAKNR